jgi:hypothetical protein
MAHGSVYCMEHTHTKPCDACGNPVIFLDPGYTLVAAALAIPCTRSALKRHLTSYTDYPRRYRLAGRGHRRQRILYASEVHRIRRRMLVGDV